MPSKSQAQQKFMGLVHALQKGDIEPSDVSQDVIDAANNMKSSDVTDFASTSHKGLPKRVKQEILRKLKEYGMTLPGHHVKPASPSVPLRNDRDMDLEEGKGRDLATTLIRNARNSMRKLSDNDVEEFRKEIALAFDLKEDRIPQNFNVGTTQDYHTKLATTPRKKYDKTNFNPTDSGQPDLEDDDVNEAFNELEHLKLLNLAMKAMPGSPKQKEIIKKLNQVRIAGGMKPIKESSIIKESIKKSDYINGLKDLQKVVKSEKGPFQGNNGGHIAKNYYEKALKMGMDNKFIDNLTRKRINAYNKKAFSLSGGSLHNAVVGGIDLLLKNINEYASNLDNSYILNKDVEFPKDMPQDESVNEGILQDREKQLKNLKQGGSASGGGYGTFKKIGNDTFVSPKGKKYNSSALIKLIGTFGDFKVNESVNEVGINDWHFKAIQKMYQKAGVFTRKKIAAVVTKNPNSSWDKIAKELRGSDYDEITSYTDALHLESVVKHMEEYSMGSYEYDKGNRELGEGTMIRRAVDIAQELLPKDTWSRFASDGKKNAEFVKNVVRDLAQSLNRFYKNHNINVRLKEGEEDGGEIDMVLGVLSILRQVDDKENRKRMAMDIIQKFKEDDVDFDYKEFLELMNEYKN